MEDDAGSRQKKKPTPRDRRKHHRLKALKEWQKKPVREDEDDTVEVHQPGAHPVPPWSRIGACDGKNSQIHRPPSLNTHSRSASAKTSCRRHRQTKRSTLRTAAHLTPVQGLQSRRPTPTNSPPVSERNASRARLSSEGLIPCRRRRQRHNDANRKPKPRPR